MPALFSGRVPLVAFIVVCSIAALHDPCLAILLLYDIYIYIFVNIAL